MSTKQETNTLDTIIDQRQQQANMKKEALLNRHIYLGGKCQDGLAWLDDNVGHVDWDRQLSRYRQYREMEEKLYTLMQQFQFPFNIIYIYIGHENTMLTVVPDMQQAMETFGLHPDEVLLPWEARFLLAERGNLL